MTVLLTTELLPRSRPGEHRAVARLEADGYEVYVGGLLAYSPGRPSLSCDLIEPLRVPAVDRWVHALGNQGMITVSDLACRGERRISVEAGGVRTYPARLGNPLDDEFQRWIDRLAAVIAAWDTLDPDPDAAVAVP